MNHVTQVSIEERTVAGRAEAPEPAKSLPTPGAVLVALGVRVALEVR
ncbi:hypothetical protein ACGFIJ_16355 [Microbispora bryophytorum]